jgi:outer membrane protein assembly factor BamB
MPRAMDSIKLPLQALALATVFAFTLPTAADERWPQFRGPDSDNVAKHSQSLPTTWSEQEHVMWKLPTELRGWSSPAVWNDVAVMTEATADGLRMYAMAVDLREGKLIWREKIFTNEKIGETHIMNSFASPSPVTDGTHVWVSFGSYGTACLQLSDGKLVWQRRDFPCEHYRGPGSSPYLDSAGRLFLHFDGFDLQYIVALSAKDGSTLWKKDRDIDYGTDNGDVKKAFCTPIVIEVNGKPQLISATSKAVLALNPETGDEIWRVVYEEFSTTGQPLFDGQTLYVNTGFGKAHLLAIDPTGKGDVTDSHVRWVSPKGIGSKPSQVLHDGLIFNVHDAGVVSCLDAENGEEVWSERLGNQFSASLLIADGHLYLFDHEGAGYVIEPSREYKLIAQNKLDDGCMATPVPLSDSLLIRTRSALYRIKK